MQSGWWSRLVVVGLVVGLSAGCKKPDDKTKGDAGAGASALLPGDLDAFLRDEAAPLTPEIEEKLLLGLKDCGVTDAGIDASCEGLKRWSKSRGRKTAT